MVRRFSSKGCVFPLNFHFRESLCNACVMGGVLALALCGWTSRLGQS
jgi:hypothetical protein